jgi:hypothetical protein
MTEPIQRTPARAAAADATAIASQLGLPIAVDFATTLRAQPNFP